MSVPVASVYDESAGPSKTKSVPLPTADTLFSFNAAVIIIITHAHLPSSARRSMAYVCVRVRVRVTFEFSNECEESCGLAVVDGGLIQRVRGQHVQCRPRCEHVQ